MPRKKKTETKEGNAEKPIITSPNQISDVLRNESIGIKEEIPKIKKSSDFGTVQKLKVSDIKKTPKGEFLGCSEYKNSDIKEEKKAKKETKEDKETEELAKEKSDLLVNLEDYVKSGIHLGTKVITEQMRKYVFKRRSDGLAIFNTNTIDKKIRLVASMLSNYAPEEIAVAGKREASWKALKSFSKATGIRVFTKKYPAGIITNTNLEEFTELKMMFVVDPWLDKNPIKDSLLVNIPIISLCDSNNLILNADLIIPCNNKSNKSIGLIFWILAKEYNKARKIDTAIPPLSEFTGEQ